MQRFRNVFSNRFRPARMRRFADRFGLTNGTHVLDVGGTPVVWDYLEITPRVTLLNTHPHIGPPLRDGMDEIVADGCCLPFPDRAFEVIYSNSVIEHVGTWERQQEFAREMRRVGRGYCVQTPNKFFPIEPHYLAPFMQWMPRRMRVPLIRWVTPYGWISKPSRATCESMVDEVRLLTPREMRELFPDAEIERETFLGLTKSLTAVRLPR